MITISADDQIAIVEEANLAPSVHNTQPARWLFRPGKIEIYADRSRFLKVGDPSFRDAGLSCGAAAEGTRLALAKRGIGVSEILDNWELPTDLEGEFRRAAVLKFGGAAQPDDLEGQVKERFTWRGKFAPIEQVADYGSCRLGAAITSGHFGEKQRRHKMDRCAERPDKPRILP